MSLRLLRWSSRFLVYLDNTRVIPLILLNFAAINISTVSCSETLYHKLYGYDFALFLVLCERV